MAKLITLAKKGPLGAAGTQVWVDDDAPEAQAATAGDQSAPVDSAPVDQPAAS